MTGPSVAKRVMYSQTDRGHNLFCTGKIMRRLVMTRCPVHWWNRFGLKCCHTECTVTKTHTLDSAPEQLLFWNWFNKSNQWWTAMTIVLDLSNAARKQSTTN